MIWILTGTGAFGLLVLFEIQKCVCLRRKKKDKNPWFLLGMFFLLLSFWMAGQEGAAAAGWKLWLGIVLLTLGLLFYARVLGVAAEKNYICDGDRQPVSRSGLYGCMRHPGVWSFLLCSLGYAMIYPCCWKMALWFAFLNLLYTWLQDRFFFPVYLEGYEEYRKEVPYLLPFTKKK